MDQQLSEEESNEILIEGKVVAHIEKKLAHKLYKIAKRLTDNSDQNAYIINHGETGSGKTNSAIVEAHFIRQLIPGRKEIYLFFRLDEMIEFAIRNQECTII